MNESYAGAAGLLGVYQQRTHYSSLLAACIAYAWSSRSEEDDDRGQGAKRILVPASSVELLLARSVSPSIFRRHVTNDAE